MGGKIYMCKGDSSDLPPSLSVFFFFTFLYFPVCFLVSHCLPVRSSVLHRLSVCLLLRLYLSLFSRLGLFLCLPVCLSMCLYCFWLFLFVFYYFLLPCLSLSVCLSHPLSGCFYSLALHLLHVWFSLSPSVRVCVSVCLSHSLFCSLSQFLSARLSPSRLHKGQSQAVLIKSLVPSSRGCLSWT